MKQYFLQILFLLPFLLYPQTNQRYEWEEITSLDKSGLKFLYAKSVNNFWLHDQNGFIYKYNQGKVSIIKPPVGKEFTRLIFGNIKTDFIFLAAMDSKWNTHFFELRNNKWSNNNFINKVPLQKFIVYDKNNIYGIGNFGTLIKYTNRNWTKIQTGLKSHINFGFAVSADSIYLLTKSEGIYLYNGKLFKNIKLNIPNTQISSIFNINGQLYLNDYFGQTYKYEKNKLVRVERNSIHRRTSVDDFGLINYFFDDIHGTEIKVKIPPNLKIVDILKLPDETLLFVSNKGKIYNAFQTEKIFFEELSKPYNISGDLEANSLFAVSVDFNNDNLQDLFVESRLRNLYSNFYINKGNLPFENNKHLLKFEPNKELRKLIFFDFNDDGFSDAANIMNPNKAAHISLYKNNGFSFEQSGKIILPSELQFRIPNSIVPVDFDKDGDLDICVTYYYGNGSSVGSSYIFLNSMWGTSWTMDTTYKKITAGWDSKSIFADFNGDDLNDWLIVNKWRRTKLLINKGDYFSDESSERLENNDLSEDLSAISFDYDNDGDLDIFISSDQNPLRVYRNNGSGYFTDVTKVLGIKNSIFKHRLNFKVLLNSGDFNNDGFTDLLISIGADSSALRLLINDSAKAFVNKTTEYKLKSSSSVMTLVGDLNNDGDLDIFRPQNGYDDYWENNSNNFNYLKIIPKGVISNTNGISAKIWVYKNSDNGKKILSGYKQIGSYEFSANTQSDLTAHFGVNKNYTYNIKVKFYGGSEVELKHIHTGQTLVVYEKAGIFAAVYKLPGIIFRTITDKTVQTYTIVILLSILIIFGGIRFGANRFKWKFQLISLLTAASLSIVWIIIFATRNSTEIVFKYALPIAAAFVSIFLPNLLFLISKKQLTKGMSKEKLEEELLQILITFSHGEWALRNLNGLQLFFQNFSKANLSSEKFIEQLINRKNTFVNLTKTNIENIIDIISELQFNQQQTVELKKIFSKVSRFLESIKTKEALLEKDVFNIVETGKMIERIKMLIYEIKVKIFTKFSCSPENVIMDVLNVHKSALLGPKINYEFTNNVKEKFALIRSIDLANVIDNLLNNSERAVSETEKKEITILIYEVVPKIHIEIRDTGCGIPKKEWENIFERGYSLHGSTGEGLHNVKSNISKYGGRIYIKSSRISVGTTFVIELNEGKKDETASAYN